MFAALASLPFLVNSPETCSFPGFLTFCFATFYGRAPCSLHIAATF